MYIASVPTKPIFWVGSSREEIRAFPVDARRIAGHHLHLIQQGMSPVDWKPLPDVGLGVYELRIRTGVEHRVMYISKFAEAVYVLHAFEKRTRRTRQADIDLARARLRELLNQRRIDRS